MWRIKVTVEQWRKGWSLVCDRIEQQNELWTKDDTATMLSIAVRKAFSPGCNPNETYPVIAGRLTQVRPD